MVRQLASHATRALEQAGVATLVLTGGVTRNAALRQALQSCLQPLGITALARSHRVATATLLRHLHPIESATLAAA